MDNVTHAFAGLLLANATSAWVARRSGQPASPEMVRTTMVLGLVAAELPDADLLYSGPVVQMGKLGYLLHHRGHTHTIVFAIGTALLLWWITLALRRRSPGGLAHSARIPLLALAMAGTLSHLLLDYTNSYGVHPFWPLDNRWVYGDAVFIIEPWLWVLAIPPLLLAARRWLSRTLLILLLAIILVAGFTLGQMTTALAWTVTGGAALWIALQWGMAARYRVPIALLGWLAVETVFAVSSQRARAEMVSVYTAGIELGALGTSAIRTVSSPTPTVGSVSEQLLDVALTPRAANPFQFRALAVSITDSVYRVRSAIVTPWSADPIIWTDIWQASRVRLTQLATTRCEFAYALGFMRVPVWSERRDGAVQLSDLRFGVGERGFSDVVVPEGPCPLTLNAWIPPWQPPRADALLPR